MGQRRIKHRVAKAWAAWVTMASVLASFGMAGDAPALATQPARAGTAQKIIEEANGALNIFGRELAADDLIAVTGTSSETGYLLVIGGTASIGELRAAPGDILLLPPYQRPAERHRFDAERLAAGLTDTGLDRSDAFHTALDGLLHQQARSVFWGRYVPSALNVTALGSVETELAKRSVVDHPVIQDIRFSNATSAEEIETAVIAQVSQALANRDSATLAALLNPSSFGVTNMRTGADAARTLMADRIVQSANWPRLLSNAAFVRNEEDGEWQLEGSDGRVAVGLKPLGDFAYVSFIRSGA